MGDMMDATTPVTVSVDGHRRTAIVIDANDRGGSIDLVNPDGEILARVNVFTKEDYSWLAVDIIDVKDNFNVRRALTFLNGQRSSLDAGKIVGADFRKGK
jgi:hypothetical protein